MRKFTLLICLFIIARLGFSQSYEDNALVSPPSPNALGLAKYASIPVSLYTGTPVINLPITELKGRNLNIPISVSYHASGIKVQDIASWVGSGWSLNAGGVITRTVRGLPDEEVNGFCGTNNIGEMAYQTPNNSYAQNISSGIWDGEPDLFYFNFLGTTGMFVLDETGLPVLLPYTNMKIKPAICPFGLGKWIITDANGVQYTFGNDSNSKETTTSQLTGSTTSKTYISSWYLSEIKGTDGETIQFSYNAGEAISYKYFVQSDRKKIRNWGFINGCYNDTGTTTDNDVIITISNPRYLSQITSTQGKLVFQTSLGRADLAGGRALKQIEVYDYSNTLVTGYKFVNSYFQSDNCLTSLCKRLKLDEIFEIANGVSNRVYSFDYNTTNLPSRDSHQIDHWGYYNNNAYTSKIPALNDIESPCAANHIGADKSPDSLRSRANILTKIKLASGGFREFIYSANLYSDATGNQLLTGGVRIRTINSCATPTGCMGESFYYKKFLTPTQSSGSLYEIPRYHFRSYEGSWVFMGGSMGSVGSEYLIRQSQSLTNVFDLNGYHIGYSNVKSKMTGNGYTLSYFTNLISHGDIPPNQFGYTIPTGQSGQVGANIPSDGFPYTPRTSKAWERGLLTKREVYSEANKLLSSERYKFNLNLSTIKSVTGVKSVKRASDYFGSYFYMGNYSSISKPYTLEKTFTTMYDQSSAVNDTTKRFRAISEYTINTSTLLPSQIVSYNEQNTNSKMITKNRYVSDLQYTFNWQDCDAIYNACVINCGGNNCPSICGNQRSVCIANNGPLPNPEAEAILFLTQTNQLTAPVEIQTIAQEDGIQKLISTQIFKYQKLGSSIIFAKPKSIWYINSILDLPGGTNPYQEARIEPSTGIFVIDARARASVTFDSYDASNGNLLGKTSLSGITATYQWLPLYNGSLITGITINPGAQQQTSSFQHRQLVGLTRQTDSNLRNVNYEYDQFNRLDVTKDHDLNILSRVKVRNQMEGFEARIGISGPTTINGLVIIEDLCAFQPGNSTYSWSFGDGTQATGSTLLSHIYSAPGLYTITLSKTNPDYGTASASTTLRISPGPSVSICADGPINADLCGTIQTVFGSCTSSNNHFYDPTILVATVRNGCSNNSYYWSYNSGSGWISFGSNSSSVTAPFTGVIASFDVQCRVVDTCGNESTSSATHINYYKSNSNCPTL